MELGLARGFLPEDDPLDHFDLNSEFSILDTIGRDLPSLLRDRGFRSYARELQPFRPCLPAISRCGSFGSTTFGSGFWPRRT